MEHRLTTCLSFSAIEYKMNTSGHVPASVFSLQYINSRIVKWKHLHTNCKESTINLCVRGFGKTDL